MARDERAGEREVVLQNPYGYREGRDPELAPWLERLVAELAPEPGSFAVRLSSEREMRRLNRTFRGRDYPTDVLSFP
ncbi:MAG TPA: rRNA maturation RNAse YbeY, partial [Thermoanaerobaculia bacterium]|nr:rRNA maturation RNAse YbeY [Thermoanaerobaculia bacterium]